MKTDPKQPAKPLTKAPRYRSPTTAQDRNERKTRQRIVVTPTHPEYFNTVYGQPASISLSLAARLLYRTFTALKAFHDSHAPSHVQIWNARIEDGNRVQDVTPNHNLAFTYLQLSLHLPYFTLTKIFLELQKRQTKDPLHIYNTVTWRDYDAPPKLNTSGTPVQDKHKIAAYNRQLEENETVTADTYKNEIREIMGLQRHLVRIASLSLDFDNTQTIVPQLHSIHTHLTLTIQKLNPQTYLKPEQFNIVLPKPLQYREHEVQELIETPSGELTQEEITRRKEERVEWYKRRAMDPYRHG